MTHIHTNRWKICTQRPFVLIKFGSYFQGE
jgi:hypothetical protein